MDEELITRAALEILSQGPLSLSDLAGELSARGLIEDDPDDEYLIDVLGDDVWLNGDDVAYSVPALTEGRCYTHRLTEEERSLGRLRQFPDFAGLWLHLEDEAESHGARFHGVLDEAFAQWVQCSDPAWLEPFAPGQLIQIKREGGELAVVACGETGEGAAERRAITETHSRLAAAKESGDAEDFMLELLAENPDLFLEPRPPLGELFAACRIPMVGAQIEGLNSYLDDHFISLLSGIYGLDLRGQRALAAVKSALAYWRVPELRGEVDIAETAGNMAYDKVAVAFADMYVESGVGAEPAFREFAEALSKVKGERAAAGMFLMGCVQDASFEPERARASFSMAHMRNPGYEPPIEALAAISADMGEGAEARSLYGRSTSARAREECEALDALLRAELPKVGRNEPCPCGSGRKYKSCHEGRRATVTPERREDWLVRKIISFPRRAGNGMKLATEIAHLYELLDPDDNGMVDDALILDLIAWDDSNLAAYHARRAPILPLEDEAFVAALARSTRDLWAVAAADPGRSLTLRNVRTGIEEYIGEGRGVVDAAVGKHVIARVAELPSGPRVYGMVYTVPEEEVGVVLSMLEEGMDSWDLAEWFAAGSTGPRGFSNTSGDAIVFCSVGVRLPDPGAAAATLDLSFQKSGDGAWLLIRDTEMMESAIIGSLKIEGELLVFSANSLERFAEVSGEVQRLFGNLEIVSQEFKTLAEAMAERDEPGEPAGSAVALDDPAIQAMMQEVMRKAEVRWLDESLPALRGRTPRQAVADPVLRKELESLLDQFERDEALIPKGTAAFSAARLRVLLGL